MNEQHHLTSQLNQCREKLQETQSKYMHEKARLESELAGKHQQVKMSSFEADRLRVIYEDALHALKTKQLENEAQQRKLEVMHREYQELQVNSRMKILELEAGVGNKGSKVKDDRDSRAYEIKALKHEVKVLEDLMSRTREPYGLLIQQLRHKEKALFEAQHTQEQTLAENDELRVRLTDIMEDRDSLLSDLHLLTTNQDRLEQVKELLLNILQNPKNADKLGHVKVDKLHKDYLMIGLMCRSRWQS
jgi:hypothetical protein